MGFRSLLSLTSKSGRLSLTASRGSTPYNKLQHRTSSQHVLFRQQESFVERCRGSDLRYRTTAIRSAETTSSRTKNKPKALRQSSKKVNASPVLFDTRNCPLSIGHPALDNRAASAVIQGAPAWKAKTPADGLRETVTALALYSPLPSLFEPFSRTPCPSSDKYDATFISRAAQSMGVFRKPVATETERGEFLKAKGHNMQRFGRSIMAQATAVTTIFKGKQKQRLEPNETAPIAVQEERTTNVFADDAQLIAKYQHEGPSCQCHGVESFGNPTAHGPHSTLR